MSDLAPNDFAERYKLARLDARDGYGWADLVVRYGLPQDAAKNLVMEAEYQRLAKTQDAKP
jgi:hypothetical protein